MFATYPSKGKAAYQSAYLASSSLENDTTHDAEEDVSFLNFELGVFEKNLKNVVPLIGEKCNVNQSIRTEMEAHLVGCASHRFLIFVREILAEDSGFVLQVKPVMREIRTRNIFEIFKRKKESKTDALDWRELKLNGRVGAGACVTEVMRTKFGRDTI